MAQKKNASSLYDIFRKQLRSGDIGTLYIFHGSEHYLLDRSLASLREKLVAGALSDFNHRRLNARSFSVDTLADSVNTLPAFSERTLVEVHDVDIFKLPEEPRKRLIALLSELPDTVCLVFVFNTVPYAPDGRQKLAQLLKSKAQIVEFTIQEQSKLIRWIRAHVEHNGKTISPADCEHLAFITGSSMTTLSGEIEKLCQYVEGDNITRTDIDALVTPVPDAVAYQLTDHVIGGRFNEAAHVLATLFAMQEPAQKLIYSVTMALRRLYTARLYIDEGKSQDAFTQTTGLRFAFQARNLFAAARKCSAEVCRKAVLASARAAFAMNSGANGEARLAELLAELALIFKEAR
jgi:DNA polymerase-3 subunit delta